MRSWSQLGGSNGESPELAHAQDADWQRLANGLAHHEALEVARVADALLAHDPESPAVAEVAAGHVWHARQLIEPARAVRVLEGAAGVALARHAYDTAELLLNRALELVPRLPAADEDDAALRLELAVA